MNRIRLFVIIAFLIAGGLLYFAYSRMQSNIAELQQTVKENAEPDLNLIRIKELYNGISSVGNNVRAFSVTHDQSYLVQFLEMKDTLNSGIDSLKNHAMLSGRDTIALAELDSLLDKKVQIYDSLLEISYNRVVSDAISKMDKGKLEADSIVIPAAEGGLFKRMFSSRYSRKAMQAKIDSIQNERNLRMQEFRANIVRIREEEARLLQQQSEKEIALLSADKIITGAIERLIVRLEKEERQRIVQKAEASKAAADDAVNAIRQIVIAGFLLILILLLFVFRDIDASNRRRKQLVAARLKAEKLAKAKEEFMATMSHEIRTPLTSIIGFSEKLSQTDLNAHQQKYMKAISGSSGHLLSIVNDVLDFTRIDSGKLKFEKVLFNAAEIFNDVYESLSWKAEEKNIALNLFIQPVSSLVLNGDPVRLKQVLFNLAGNAIKFTDKGAVDIRASYTGENGSGILTIKVSDTGIGIPADKLDLIFNEFEQADNNTEFRYGGSGLGLAITKRIVEQQSGTVKVDSTPGLGSVFTAVIPFEAGEMQKREAVKSNETISSLPLKGLSMILAEDDPMIRELQHHSLEGLGAKVMLAQNGREAVEILRNTHADFILMDIQMPELSGPEAVKVIRNNFPPAKKNIPVIAMTANVLQHDLVRWMEEGMSDFITKPFREQELVEKISRLLNIGKVYNEPKVQEAEKVVPYEFAMARPEKLYDLKELVDASQGNPEFIRKMINLFLTSSFASVNNLKFHLKQNNWDQLAKTSHRMIGSYKQLGIDYVAAMLKELEGTCLNSRELGKAAWLVSETEKYSNEVFTMLKKDLENY
jgi:signal transduction histidine kinase/CheY-like chemotaxis protein/HPt (histidine-containing phosphotransfer) domain-containing protein